MFVSNSTVATVFLTMAALSMSLLVAADCPKNLIGTYEGYLEISISGLETVGGCLPCDNNPDALCDYDSGLEQLTANPCIPAMCGSIGNNHATITNQDDGNGKCELLVTPPKGESCR